MTNTTNQVKSFTVKATYKVGEQIVATASGAVNDLQPGQKRAASLLSQTPIPTTFDTVRVDVDTMVREAATTPGATAASKISFGTPAAQGAGGMTTISVETKNNDMALHSFTVQIAYFNGEDLVGIATGAMNDLEVGQTKTATLLVQGQATGEAKISVETLVK